MSLYQQRWGRAIRSSSAEKVAMLRAVGSMERDAAVRNPDYLAADFVGSSRMYRLGLSLASAAPLRASARLMSERLAAGGYWAETARVKYYDEILREELSSGIQQVIVLGAGLDSRAYRFANQLGGARFFEVDHPATAVHKRERVEATFGSLPTHVTYVAHDLTTGNLEEVLADAGFDAAIPVLVLWIGVSMYLPPDVVDAVLAWAGGLAEDSSFAFDYVDRSFFDEKRRFGPAGRFRIFIGLSGERFECGFDRSSLTPFLEGRGFAVRSHLGPQDAEQRYLRRSNGRSTGPPFAYWGYVHAAIPAKREPIPV